MIDGRRLAYLEALDIPVWVAKGNEAARESNQPAGRIHVGPGNSSTLFVCPERSLSSGKLASDIARVFSDAPVWAWSAPDGEGLTAAEAIQESLFTCLIIFGPALAERLLGAGMPEQLGSARVLVTDDLEALGRGAEVRRRFWSQLCTGGIVEGR